MELLRDILNNLSEGKYDEKLESLYGKDRLERERKRYTAALCEFASLYGGDRKAAVFSAPGRTEIGGNHTDHQHGQVLAASISDDCIAVASPCSEPSVRLLSKGFSGITVSLESLSPGDYPEGTTSALIAGVLAGAKERGFTVGGFDAYVTSDVLSGSGLSSSAAFETVIGQIISGLYNGGGLSDPVIAMIGQYAENVYFGKPCGLMDQMACSVGSVCHMDFANPEDPAIEKLDFDPEQAGYSLCITDTKGSHADLTPDYAAVPAEMKEVAALLGAEVLSQVPEESVLQNAARIREACGDRAFLRALHYYEENKRVLSEKEAIRRMDMAGFLEQVTASGNSSFKYLQNVFTTHDIRHQNVSVALMRSEQVLEGKGACRVHGGGFAGTIQAFVAHEAVDRYKAAMDSLFGPDACRVLSIRKAGGLRVL